MTFLYAAYTVTWVILIGYLIILTLSFSNLRDEVDELKK